MLTLTEKIEKLSHKEQKEVEKLVDELLKGKNLVLRSSKNGQKAFKKSDYTTEDLLKIAALYSPDTIWTHSLLQEAFPFEYKVKVEILTNQLYIMPAPTAKHQEVVKEISFALHTFVKQHNMGKILFAPLDVYLDEDNLVQPDILFIKIGRNLENEKGFIEGVPDLVVEVISPSNYKKRREKKIAQYEKFGVSEYWEIRPKKKSCLVQILKNGKYETFSEAKKKGKVKSAVLEGFELNVEDIFNG